MCAKRLITLDLYTCTYRAENECQSSLDINRDSCMDYREQQQCVLAYKCWFSEAVLIQRDSVAVRYI